MAITRNDVMSTPRGSRTSLLKDVLTRSKKTVHDPVSTPVMLEESSDNSSTKETNKRKDLVEYKKLALRGRKVLGDLIQNPLSQQQQQQQQDQSSGPMTPSLIFKTKSKRRLSNLMKESSSNVNKNASPTGTSAGPPAEMKRVSQTSNNSSHPSIRDDNSSNYEIPEIRRPLRRLANKRKLLNKENENLTSKPSAGSSSSISLPDQDEEGEKMIQEASRRSVRKSRGRNSNAVQISSSSLSVNSSGDENIELQTVRTKRITKKGNLSVRDRSNDETPVSLGSLEEDETLVTKSVRTRRRLLRTGNLGQEQNSLSLAGSESPDLPKIVKRKRLDPSASKFDIQSQEQQEQDVVNASHSITDLGQSPRLFIRKSKRNTRRDTIARVEGLKDVVASQDLTEQEIQNEEGEENEDNMTFAPNIESTRVYEFAENSPANSRKVGSNSASIQTGNPKNVTSTPMANANAQQHRVSFYQEHFQEEPISFGKGEESLVEDRPHRKQVLCGSRPDMSKIRDIFNKEQGIVKTPELEAIIDSVSKNNMGPDGFKVPEAPTASKRRAAKRFSDPRQVFSPNEVKHKFLQYSTTSAKLTPKSMPALMDISNRFCSKMIKHLSKGLQEEGRSKMGLLDVKEMMKDFGMIPGQDPRNFKLYSKITDHVFEAQKTRSLLPYLFNDSIPADIWDTVPKERRGSRQRRRRT